MKVTFGAAVIEGYVRNTPHSPATVIIDALDNTVWDDGEYNSYNQGMSKVRITIEVIEVIED